MLLIASRARSSVTQRTVLRTQQNPVPNIFPPFRILTMLEGFNIQHGSWPSPKGNKKPNMVTMSTRGICPYLAQLKSVLGFIV